jgi:hypothetical protein
MPAIPKPNQSNFLPAPNGPQPAVCIRIIDLGTQDGDYKGKPNRKRKFVIGFELFSDERMSDGRPFIVNHTYTWSMSDKARLRKDLESWRGKEFNDADFDEKTGFQIKNILDKSCLLNIKHETKEDGNVRAVIDSISRLPKQMTVGKPESPLTYVWLSLEEFDFAQFNTLGEYHKEQIMKSPEYGAIVRGEKIDDTAPAAPQADDDFGDTIPF